MKMFFENPRGDPYFLKKIQKKFPKNQRGYLEGGVVLRVKVTDTAVKHNLYLFCISSRGPIRGEFLYLLPFVYPSHQKIKLSVKLKK